MGAVQTATQGPKHFLDSGAFTIRTEAARYAKQHGTAPYAYYDTEAFWDYMRSYVRFVQRYAAGIDLYANVDVIPNPELSWRNQCWLEKRGLKPVPVVHFGTDLKWLQKYLDRGDPVIGFGGLVGKTAVARAWLDRAFALVCGPDGLPRTQLHGFGIVNWWMLMRYPWASVDSAAWIKEAGRWGNVFVPHQRGGEFVFDEAPYKVMFGVSGLSAQVHYLELSRREKVVIEAWLEKIGTRVGEFHPDGSMKTSGVLTNYLERGAANIDFFEHLTASLPDYPWAFQPRKQRAGFGL